MDINEVLQKAGENLAVGRAFGAPYEQDGTLVIPVAIVGGGGGGGRRAKPAEEEGGGFGGLVYPLGSYVVKGGQVRFVPAFDVTLIVTGALLLMRLVVKRSRRRLQASYEAGPRRPTLPRGPAGEGGTRDSGGDSQATAAPGQNV